MIRPRTQDQSSGPSRVVGSALTPDPSAILAGCPGNFLGTRQEHSVVPAVPSVTNQQYDRRRS